MDNGCSRHIIQDKSKFVFLTKRKNDFVIFKDNAKGRIISQGNVGNNTSFLIEKETFQVFSKFCKKDLKKKRKKKEYYYLYKK